MYKHSRIKKGIKVWALWDSTLGFCVNFWNFWIYTNNAGNEPGVGFSKIVFFVLLSYSYFDKGYIIYMDDLYTRLKLAKDLLGRDTFVYGMVRTNRGHFSEPFNTTKLK